MNVNKVVLVMAMLLTPLMVLSQVTERQEIGSKNSQFAKEVDKKREQAGLVGLSVLVLKDGVVALSASSGERKKGSDVPIGNDDKWHIGSVTKSFTSTMIARLVEKEQLQWDTRVGDVFKGQDINSAWRDVTLAQLLTHTSGADANFPVRAAYAKPEKGESVASLREREVHEVLSKPPAGAPGRTFAYSNLGYTIAGAMSEKVTGLDWDDLVVREVLEPLKIRSWEFGPPQGNGEKLDQPRGHKRKFGFVSAADPTDDLPPLVAPAGRLSMTLADLAVYAQDHLEGELGKGKLLQPETYRRLHSPVMGDYGYGWATMPSEDWSNGDILWHNGSNGMWYTLMVLVPNTNSIVLVAMNDGNVAVAEPTAWDIVKTALTTLADDK